MPVQCPGCGHLLTVSAPTCPRCGLRLVGPDAVRLWQVDQALVALNRERAELLLRLQAPLPSAPPTPPAAWTSPDDAWSVPGEPPSGSAFDAPFDAPPASPSGQRLRPSLAPQTLLLTLGAALLLVASVVFVAVSWHSLGLGIQVAVLLAATAGAAWGSVACGVRRLRASAESLAVVASGLLVIDLWAAWRFDLLGLRGAEPRVYAGFAAVLAAGLLAGASVRAPGLRTYPVVAVVSAQLALLALPEPAHLRAVAVAGVLLLLSGADRLAARVFPEPARTAARACAGLGWLAGSVIAVTVAAFATAPPATDRARAWVAVTCVAVAAASVLPPLSADLEGRPFGLAAGMGVVLTVLDTRFVGALLGRTPAWCALAVAGAALSAVSAKVRGRASRWILAGGLAVAALDGLSTLSASRPVWWIAAYAVGIALLAVGAQVPGEATWSYPAGATALMAGLAGALDSANLDADVVTSAVVGASVVVLAVAGWRRTRPECAGLLAVAALSAVLAFRVEFAARHPLLLAAQFAVAGLAWLVFATLPAQQGWAVAAFAALAAAQICQLADQRLHPVELGTVALGALAGTASFLANSALFCRRVLVAAAALALTPSIVAGFTQHAVGRPLTVAVIALALFWLAASRSDVEMLAVSAPSYLLGCAALVHFGDVVALASTLGLGAVVVGVHAALQRRYPDVEIPASATLGSASCVAALTAANVAPGVIGTLLAGLGVVWLGWAAARRGKPEERALYGLTVVTAAWGIVTTLPYGAWMSLSCAVFGAGCLTVASKRGYGGWAVPGVALVTIALWHHLGSEHVRLVEAYTLPLAGVLLMVGLVRFAHDRHTPSWSLVGPALVVGLVPSALVASTDAAPLRPAIVLGAAAATLLVGLRLRWQAAVVPSALCLALVALAQLAPFAVGAPRWLTLGGLGLLLLATGARYERRLRDVKVLKAWLSSLR